MWMTMAEVLAELGVARSTMDDWRAHGVGPTFKRLPNGKLRLHRREFEKWLAALPEVA